MVVRNNDGTYIKTEVAPSGSSTRLTSNTAISHTTQITSKSSSTKETHYKKLIQTTSNK